MEPISVISARAADAETILARLGEQTLSRTEVLLPLSEFERNTQSASKLAHLSPAEPVEVSGVGTCVMLGDGPEISIQENESLSDVLYRYGFSTRDAERMQTHLNDGETLFFVPSEDVDASGLTVALERAPRADVARPERARSASHGFRALRGGTRVQRDVRPVQFVAGFRKS